MVRLLIVEDAQTDAELTVRQLQSEGIDCSWERVETEAAFRIALKSAPDVIICDRALPCFDGLVALSIAVSAAPLTPFIFVSETLDSDRASEALKAGATDYIPKGDRARLAVAVRRAIDRPGVRQRRVKDRSASPAGVDDGAGAAHYLLDRRAALDDALLPRDPADVAHRLGLAPPIPAALLMIQATHARDRFVKLLVGANVEIDEADSCPAALECLAARVHALMFTDSLELVRAARQLPSGSATHIAFVNAQGDAGYREALRAGANDCMPSDARGEQFWAHLTIARHIADLAASLQSALTDNRILSTIDELTRCGSRRFFEQQFPREVERAARLAKPLTLVMCDIDYFKRINDTHGHQIGDEVLREFADRITGGLRVEQDWVARIGGEEFAIVLPDTPPSEARTVAARLREQIASVPFQSVSAPIPVTASFGTCALDPIPNDWRHLAERMVRAADAALYQSKRRGRNRVTAATPVDSARGPVATSGTH